MKKILHLNLKYKYWDEIYEGIKIFEYREARKYWVDRLENKIYDEVWFHRGYTSTVIKCAFHKPEKIWLNHEHFGLSDLTVYAIRTDDRL